MLFQVTHKQHLCNVTLAFSIEYQQCGLPRLQGIDMLTAADIHGTEGQCESFFSTPQLYDFLSLSVRCANVTLHGLISSAHTDSVHSVLLQHYPGTL